MKLRLPIQLRKALMFCVIACTAPAMAQSGALPSGSVLFVFHPEAEEEEEPAAEPEAPVSIEELVEAQEGLSIGEDQVIMLEDNYGAISPEARPGVLAPRKETLTGLNFSHRAIAADDKAVEKGTAAVLRAAELLVAAENGDEGLRKKVPFSWPLSYWGDEADTFGGGQPLHNLENGYVAVHVGSSHHVRAAAPMIMSGQFSTKVAPLTYHGVSPAVCSVSGSGPRFAVSVPPVGYRVNAFPYPVRTKQMMAYLPQHAPIHFWFQTWAQAWKNLQNAVVFSYKHRFLRHATHTGTAGRPATFQLVDGSAVSPAECMGAPMTLASLSLQPEAPMAALVLAADDGDAPAIKVGNNYHWSATNGDSFTWSTSKWDTENYTNSTASNIFFDDAEDDAQGAKTFTVNLGSANVTAGNMTVTGNDTYHIVSPTGGRKIKVNNFTMDGGTLYFNGDSSNDVALDIAGTGTFRMDNGAYAEFRKVNAQNLGRVELDNGSTLVVTRDIATLSSDASSFEARYLVIDHNSTLEARSAGYGIKIADAEIKNGGKLLVSAPFLHYKKGGSGALSDIHITLANGGILENTKSATADAITIGYIAGRTSDITSTLTATGTSDSYLRGFWRLGTNTAAQAPNAILDVSGDYRPIVIGGDANIDSSLIIGKAGWTLNLGDKWDGTSAMTDPITLFTTGLNGQISIGTDVLNGNVEDCLKSLNNFYVSYGSGTNLTTVDLKVAVDDLQPYLSYQDGQLVFSIKTRSEYVWHYDKGESMTWTQQDWDATPYAYQSSVKFTTNGDSAPQTVTVGIDTKVDGVAEYLVAHNIEVEGEDTFVWNVDGRIQASSLTKSGSGDLTINALDLGARPTVDIVGGAFTVTGGNVTANAQLRAKYFVIDGTQNTVSFTDQYKVNGNPDPAITNTQDSVIINGAGGYFRIIGAGAQADINRICSSNNNNDTTVEVLDGAALNLYRGSTSLEVRNVVVSGSDSRLNMNTGSIRVSNLTIADGGYVATKNRFISTSYNETVPNMALNLRNGGVLENTGSNPITLNRVESTSGGNTYKSELTLELTGTTPSVLLGEWMWDASIKSVISYADDASAALTIRNGTFNIFNTTTATETDALTIDLSSHWNGEDDITRRILRIGSGGTFNVNGQSVAAGDITSLFNNIYVRYTDGDGNVQTINLSSTEALNHPEHYYQLLWENNSLFFTSARYDENGPFEWRHSYEELYGTVNPDETLTAYRLTWKNGGEWHPDSHNYDGPTTGNPNALIYRNEHAVSFMGDTDEEVDTVHVTIDGTVAPGDFVHGIAGVRVTGADNFVFEGVNGASISDVTIDKEVSTSDGNTQVVKEIKTPTTLSKSGSGTLTIASNVKLDYTGRTEVLGGKMELLGAAWTPAGTVTVAEGATLQVGDSNHMGSMSTNVFTLGANMVDNNGFIQTNIVHTTGTTVTGEGRWNACYYLLEKTSFHAGIVELPALVGSSIRASFVLNNGDAVVSQYFDGSGQNLTLMNRGFMSVGGTHGATADNAALEAYNVIITGQGSGLDFTGTAKKDKSGAYTTHATLRAQTIDLTHGATLGLAQELEHVGDNKLVFTLGHGSTLRNNRTSTIVLNPNKDAQFDLIVKASDTPNYFQGNWTVDLSHPFLLDYSNFDNQTVVVPIHEMDGTMTLANANKSLDATTGLSNFVFRVDSLKYDTYEIMAVGERGKIALDLTVGDKHVNTVLTNDTDYFSHLGSMGYIFHEDAKGREIGWHYVDLVNMTTLEGASFDSVGNLLGYTGTKTLTDSEFTALTGLDKGINFSLLYERNILSLIVAPDGPTGTRQYYFWSGRSDSGVTTGNYDTWTRHNSTELSPWSDDDIFQNGYLTIFADVDIHGNKIGSYTVEIENSVATGSKPLQGVTRPGFEVAAIHFDNRSVANYTVQSEKYDGSGCIADIYEFDASGNATVDVTKLIVNGGFVEIKTGNTYGGKLSQNSSAENFTTIVKSVVVGEGDCNTVSYKGAEVKLSELGVEDARAAHLVNYSRYTYAYKDDTGVHFITNDDYETGKYADKNPERVYITQRTDGSNLWFVRGSTIPVTMKENLAVVYDMDVLTAHAYTEKDANGIERVYFISGADWDSGKYADKNAMEVVLTPSNSNHVTWAVRGADDGSDFFESVSESRLDTSLIQTKSTTYAFAYQTTDSATNTSTYHMVTEKEYQLWNAWTEAGEENKADCFAAFSQANAQLAQFAKDNPGILVQEVSVVRNPGSGSNVDDITWTINGTYTQNFAGMSLNQVYAYKSSVDGKVHMLTEEEIGQWRENPASFGHDVKQVGVFGPVDGKWNLYTVDAATGKKTYWESITSRPEVYFSEDAYLRTTDTFSAYAYVTEVDSNNLNHTHLISQAQYDAWTAWADVAYKEGSTEEQKAAAYSAFVASAGEDFASMASGLNGVLPEAVRLSRYENEQSYHVVGAAIHDNLTTRAIANNYTYAYGTTDDEGNQQVNFITEAEFKAWNPADHDGIKAERVDLAYFTQINNATGASESYWMVLGDTLHTRVETMLGHQAYGSAYFYAYQTGDGKYHVLSETEYNAWDPAAHGGIQAVRVDMTAESTIKLGEGEEPYSETQWTLRNATTGASVDMAAIGSMEALAGKVYSYAYTNVDSLGRTHVHFISAEDYANGTYASHNPLEVTLSMTPQPSSTHSWLVKGTGADSQIDDKISTRSISNNYAYAYKTLVDGEEQVIFITAAEYRDWVAWTKAEGDEAKAAALAKIQTATHNAENSDFYDVLTADPTITPERVDLTYVTQKGVNGVISSYWQLNGSTISTTMDSMAGEYTYGCAFVYMYTTGEGASTQYHVIDDDTRAAWNAWKNAADGDKAAALAALTDIDPDLAAYASANASASPVRVDMSVESVIQNAADGTISADNTWTLRVADGSGTTIDINDVGGISALSGKVYSYAYRAEDGTLQFITVADYNSGDFGDLNPERVALGQVSDSTFTWNVRGGGIDAIVDVSDIPNNLGGNVFTDTKTEHYTYIVVTRDEFGNISGQFISERDVNDKNYPAEAIRDGEGNVNVQRLVLVQQADGKWFVPEKGYTMALETLEVTVDTTEFFGYGYYDERGQLHLTTQDAYYADNGSSASGLEGATTPLRNTQLIRLVYDPDKKQWYTPGVLLASNEHALGTSEVFVGYGSRLLATTNLYLTSLSMEAGANIIARQNLDINKPLTVAAGSYFEVDGTLTCADITVEGGSTFLTHNVSAKNVTILSGARWDLNASGTSVLDISDRLVIHGGAEITGNAVMRDGLLELVAGDDNPYVTITGTLQLGTDATLDLTKLMPEGAGHHFRSPLKVSEGGRIILEPHDSVLLSMDQVNHLLMDHNTENGETIEHRQHVMHIATLGAGANFSLLETYVDDNGYLQSKENPLPTVAVDNYDTVPSNIGLAEGLGYLVNASFSRRHITTGSEAGLDEVVLHLSVKEDAPAYVWDGVYNGRGHADNDNVWCMYNGGTLVDGQDIETSSHAWSGNAIYGDPKNVDPGMKYLDWGQEVYFLEVGFDKNQKAAFSYHYVNEGGKAATDLTNRAKYVDIRGEVWSKTITVDVDRLYDMTLEQYLRNVGYMFYSSDGTGTITDSWYDPATGRTMALSSLSAEEAAAAGFTRQATNIVKAGTGVLTLNTENSFSGDILLNSGSVFATNEKALGTAHVKMMDQTGLYINYLFEMKGDSAFRNPVLTNEITVWGGGNFEAQAERALTGSEITSVTVGYNPISVIDVMCDIQGGDTSTMREESTSRHWRTLSITGPLHGDKNTEITLQGYTSYTGSVVYTSMFHIYGTEGLTDFAGTIKLQNYRNISPAAYSGVGNTFMNDTNQQRGTGALELMISDGTLQYATLDLTRANVLASYTKDDAAHTQGFARRQTPTHILLLRGDSAVGGLNADFLGTIVRAQRDAEGNADSGKVEILVATQAQELASVRTIATGNYTLSLHSEDMQDFVYSGVLGGKYAYAGEGSGTIPEAGEDATGARISNGMVSLLHTGDGAQYIHTGYLQDLTIGNEQVGSYAKASGGTVGFHYLDLQGNLTLHSGATLKLDVDDCVRTAVQTGDAVAVHWDESAFSSDNVVIHAGKHANIITTHTKTATVPDLTPDGKEAVTVTREVPMGSYIDGNLTVDGGSYLDFYSRAIEPLPVVEGHTSADWAQQMTNPAFHPEAGVAVTAPETGYLLDISGALILKGDVHVDFAGVEFDSAKNGVTYFLARAQKGLIGSVNQQTISLGNGYYGVIRGLETYDRKVSKVELPGNGATYVPPTELTAGGSDLSMDALTEVRVNLTAVADSTDYFFNYKTYVTDAEGVETMQESSLTLTQVSGNVYHYEVNGNSYEAVLLYTYDNLGNVTSTAARMNLIFLAYQENAGYIIMTVTNTPPRVWFNTDNVISPTGEIGVQDGGDTLAAGKRIMVTPDGTKYINASDSDQYDGALGFGDVSVDTLWTGHGPNAASWIDSHLAFEPGCRVQFNKYGTARYLGEGQVQVLDQPGTETHNVYTRGDQRLIYNKETGEYGLLQADVWHPMVAEMYGEQFDIVELEGNVQARSIFVNCETGIHADDGTLLINSPRSGFVNYWFREADGEDPGYIGDIEVTDINRDTLSANIYDVKIGQVLAVSLEKTGGGYLRISTHNSYSGGTLLKDGSLIIDYDDALGMASSKPEAGGGDGALHAFGGSTLFLNYVGDADTSKFTNDIKVYSVDPSVIGTGREAMGRLEGFKVTNGINLKGGAANVHFVELNGAVQAVDADSVLTLSGLIVAENKKGYRDFTSFSLANLEGYSGVVRMDSHFASNAEGIGSVDGIYEKEDGSYDYVVLDRTFKRSDTGATVAKADVMSYYDSKKREIVYYIDETVGGTTKRVYLTHTDTYRSVTDSAVTYTGADAAKVITGGEVELRVTGGTLGSAVVDLGLNSAYHNAIVLDMNGTNTLGGVRGLVGGELTKDAVDGWLGYNSNVVAAKSSTLNLDVSYGNATYAGNVGYGYYHAASGENAGLVHASSVMALEKNGSSMQTIYSARLNNLNIKEGNVQFVKDLILSGKLTMAKETQLIIGTIDDVDYTSTDKAPYSIVVQGDGILALGDAHTTTYTSKQDNGTEFSVTNSWSKFETAVTAYNQEDKNPDALLRGGTLTAVTDVSTSLSAHFQDSFTIDTSDYDYERGLLLAEGIEKSATDPTHTITLKGKLNGSGTVTVTGGGTFVIDGREYEVREKDAMDNLLGTDKIGNEFSGASTMAFLVQDGTTMRLAQDHALTYYDDVMEVKTYSYKDEGNNSRSKSVLVSTGTKKMQGAATVEVLKDSHVVVDEGVHAQIAAARLVDNGDLIVEGAEHAALAKVSSSGNTATDAATAARYGVGGDSATLNIANVEVASDNGKAAFTGMYADKAANTINHNATVEVSSGVEASMSMLTLGSGTGDHTSVELGSDAILELGDVVVERASTVAGTGAYSGVFASADGKELVSLTNTTVVAQLGDNLEQEAGFAFTGESGKYTTGNSGYIYSVNAFAKEADQTVFTLNNFQDCILTGSAGQLILQLSDADYEGLLASAGENGLLGIYLPGVALLSGTSENLLTVQSASGDSTDSVFYVASKGEAGEKKGTTFYMKTPVVPEPATGTLSVLALAALCARRRRRK